MPELDSILPRLTPRLLFIGVFAGNNNLSLREAVLRKNIARLADKAVYEYSLARQAILDQVAEGRRTSEEMIKTGRIIYMFGFINHMENCINATHRAIKFVSAVRASDRTRRRLMDAHADPIAEVRDALEHMDDRLNKGEIGSSGPIMLNLGDDQASVRLGEWSIPFSSLVTVIQALHAEATDLLNRTVQVSAT